MVDKVKCLVNSDNEVNVIQENSYQTLNNPVKIVILLLWYSTNILLNGIYPVLESILYQSLCIWWYNILIAW